MKVRTRTTFKASATNKVTGATTSVMMLDTPNFEENEKAARLEAAKKIGVSRFANWNIEVW
jgi:hypothetical protein